MYNALKAFQVDEGSIANLGYKIVVKDAKTGTVVDVFERPTMLEAQAAFEAAGYFRTHGRII